MSSTNKTANYQLSQFVGTDIPSILNDYNGDMRKIDTAIKEVANAEGSSQSDIAGLQATVGQHTTEIGGINSTVNALSGRVLGIESKIPANASESNKLITAEDIPEIPSIEGLEQDVADLQEEVSDMSGDVKAIQLCVPASASEDNKFATMADISENGMETIATPIMVQASTTIKQGIENALHTIANAVGDNVSPYMLANLEIWMDILGESTDSSDVYCYGSLKFVSGYYHNINTERIMIGQFSPRNANDPSQIITLVCYVSVVNSGIADLSNATVTKVEKYIDGFDGTPSATYPYDCKSNAFAHVTQVSAIYRK